MNCIRKNIPNAVTLLNVLGGCLAIVCASRGTAEMWCGLAGYQWAYLFVGISAVADFLDGFMARLLHAYSELGKELDSLCDMVSFGVAPAMLLYHLLSEAEPQWAFLPWLAFLIPLAAALRLAKFNVDTRQTTSFIGLPVPANAIFWIGFTSLLVQFPALAQNAWLVAIIVALESWLMVSPLKIFSLKTSSLRWKGNEKRWILVVLACVLVYLLGISGLMWLIIAYVAISAFPERKL